MKNKGLAKLTLFVDEYIPSLVQEHFLKIEQ